jgi:hypothetical protein
MWPFKKKEPPREEPVHFEVVPLSNHVEIRARTIQGDCYLRSRLGEHGQFELEAKAAKHWYVGNTYQTIIIRRKE